MASAKSKGFRRAAGNGQDAAFRLVRAALDIFQQLAGVFLEQS